MGPPGNADARRVGRTLGLHGRALVSRSTADEPGPERAERPEEGAPGVRGIGVKTPRHKRLHAGCSIWLPGGSLPSVDHILGRAGRWEPLARRGEPCIRISAGPAAG